jgi:hypothetical protein
VAEREKLDAVLQAWVCRLSWSWSCLLAVALQLSWPPNWSIVYMLGSLIPPVFSSGLCALRLLLYQVLDFSLFLHQKSTKHFTLWG